LGGGNGKKGTDFLLLQYQYDMVRPC